MNKFRISITATLLAASLICTVLALTPDQKRAFNVCYANYTDGVAGCYNYWHAGSDGLKSCLTKCGSDFKTCKRNAGIPLDTNPPPKLPRPTPGGNINPPSKKPPGPPPGQIKSTPTPAPPTIYSKPSKPSPTPKKDHQPKHDGHKG